MAGKGGAAARVPSWEAILAALVLGFAGAVIGALVGFVVGVNVHPIWATGTGLSAWHGHGPGAIIGAGVGALPLGGRCVRARGRRQRMGAVLERPDIRRTAEPAPSVG